LDRLITNPTHKARAGSNEAEFEIVSGKATRSSIGTPFVDRNL